MSSVSTTPFHLTMLRKANTWYSQKDGNFNDPSTWLSNGRKRYSYPQPGDNVYVNHVVTVNISATVNNVYVTGVLKLLNFVLTINGDLQVIGSFDQTGGNSTVILKGVNNFINNFLPGTSSSIEYARNGDQDIMYLPYYNLRLSGSGNKYVYGDLTIGGITNIIGTAVLYKVTATGKVTFVGLLTNLGYSSSLSGINNLVNADLEFQAGISLDMRGATLNLGSGNLYLSGANVQLGFGAGTIYNNFNTIIIKGSSIVTVNSNTPFIINGSINGEMTLSTLRISGAFYQATALTPMSGGGVFEHNYTNGSLIGYVMNGDYTLPFTTYSGLTIMGSGTKTLAGDTILIGKLSISSSIVASTGKLELSGYNLTINDTTTLNPGGFLTKNEINGQATFVGLVTSVGTSLNNGFEFNGLNNVIEFRGGFLGDYRSFASFNVAIGALIKCTTNNQTLQFGLGGPAIDGNFLVSGPITATISSTNGLVLNGSANGNDALSKLSVQTGSLSNIVTYKNAQQPMQTGILDCNTAPNGFVYNSFSNQNIAAGIYRNLSLLGNGEKKLSGNVSVINSYTLSNPATLNLNGFTLTNP